LKTLLKAVLKAVVIASAGLLLATAIPLPRDAPTSPVFIGIAVMTVALLLTTELDTLWIILGSALISWSASGLGLVTRI
jgi:chromate transporter